MCSSDLSGSIVNVPLVRATEAEFVAWAKGREVVGTAGAAEMDYREAKVGADAVVLMGGESDGLTRGLVTACSKVVRIPMWGRTESLNLAVSTGVMLYEVMRIR